MEDTFVILDRVPYMEYWEDRMKSKHEPKEVPSDVVCLADVRRQREAAHEAELERRVISRAAHLIEWEHSEKKEEGEE